MCRFAPCWMLRIWKEAVRVKNENVRAYLRVFTTKFTLDWLECERACWFKGNKMSDGKVEAIVTAAGKVIGTATLWIDENGLHIEQMQEE